MELTVTEVGIAGGGPSKFEQRCYKLWRNPLTSDVFVRFLTQPGRCCNDATNFVLLRMKLLQCLDGSDFAFSKYQTVLEEGHRD